MFHRRVIKVGQTVDTLHSSHLNTRRGSVSMPGLHETPTQSLVNHAQGRATVLLDAVDFSLDVCQNRLSNLLKQADSLRT